MWLTLLWNNRRLITEIVGLVLVCLVAWYFFIHNPKVIRELEADKAELARQVSELQAGQKLLAEIEQGKKGIDIEVFKNISTIRAAAVPRRRVLVKSGVPL